MELNPSLTDESDALVPRKSALEDAHFDITAMVDLVFMMNIFFLVTWVGAALKEIDLPTARHCVPADPEACVTVTVYFPDASTQTPFVYVGEDKSSARPVDSPELEEEIRKAVENGKMQIPPKDTLLIKAAKHVREKDVVRVAGAGTAVEGTKLNLAVVEKE
jgi:biopolymer transport protein ExbD